MQRGRPAPDQRPAAVKLDLGSAAWLAKSITTLSAESYKAEVVRVLAVVDRGQGAGQIFQQRGYPFTPLFSIAELMPAEK